MVRYKSKAQPAWEMRIAAQLICEMDNAGWHSVQKAEDELMRGVLSAGLDRFVLSYSHLM